MIVPSVFLIVVNCSSGVILPRACVGGGLSSLYITSQRPAALGKFSKFWGQTRNSFTCVNNSVSGNEYMLWPLVFAFIGAETLGILFTVKDAGTLTDTTAKYVPEDFTFIFLGLMLCWLSQWLTGWIWIVWVLGAWLLQHFIVHYLQIDKTGWEAPRKIRKWYRASVSGPPATR